MRKTRNMELFVRTIKKQSPEEIITIRYYDSASGKTYGKTEPLDSVTDIRPCASPLFLSRAIKRSIKKTETSENSRIERHIKEKIYS